MWSYKSVIVCAKIWSFIDKQSSSTLFVLLCISSYTIIFLRIRFGDIRTSKMWLYTKKLGRRGRGVTSFSDKQKSSTYVIILSKAILPNKSHWIWQNSRLSLVILGTLCFEACATLRVTYPLLDSYHKLLWSPKKMVKKSELEIIILHDDLNQQNMLRSWENDDFILET